MEQWLKTMYENRDWLHGSAVGRVLIGLNAMALGDYAAAAAHLEASRSTFRKLRLDDLDEDAWAQSAQALLHHQQGEDRTARQYAQSALAIHRKTRHSVRTAEALTRLGHALTALGELSDATAAYQEALGLRREIGQRHLVPEPLAGLARVALLQDDPERALIHMEEILNHLETGSLDGTDEPLRIYLTCYHVLKARNDPRAEQVLEEAHGLLQERAAKITDGELQRSFLDSVAAHRELVSEWRAVNRKG
jgi:tetratricopeptide (TPR) repeat protein